MYLQSSFLLIATSFWVIFSLERLSNRLRNKFQTYSSSYQSQTQFEDMYMKPLKGKRTNADDKVCGNHFSGKADSVHLQAGRLETTEMNGVGTGLRGQFNQ